MKITKSKSSALLSFAGLMMMLAGLASSVGGESNLAFIACGALFLVLAAKARRRERAVA